MEKDASLETLGKAGMEAVAVIKSLPAGVNLWFKEDLPTADKAFEKFAKGEDNEETLEALRDLKNKTIAAPEGSNAEWNVWNKYVLVGTLDRTASLEEICRLIEEKIGRRRAIQYGI